MYTLSQSLTYDLVRIRSVVEHVVTVTPVLVSPPYSASLRREAMAMEGALGHDIDSHTMHTLTSDTHASAMPPPSAAGEEEGWAQVSRYANVPATPALHALQTQLLAASNVGPYDSSARTRMGASGCDASH